MRLSSWLPLVCLQTAIVIAQDMSEHIVDLGYAKFRGNQTTTNSVAYLGIPYAQAPVGDLRFRAPVPVDTTGNATNVTDAMSYPVKCIEANIPGGTEDCLKLNVYAPANATSSSNLPVLFYIHGGGYFAGDPLTWPFDTWIEQSPNIVVVSVYYRLSAFGFLSHPDLQSSGEGDLNAGFLDQIAAMEWTQEFIGTFGGDKDKITINGQSAGGSSVHLHLVANQPQRFSGAIVQSDFRHSTPTPDQTVTLFNNLTTAMNCTDGSFSEQMDCLRAANSSELAAGLNLALNTIATASFRPVQDGEIITEPQTKSILDGNYHNVPLIVGATTNDTTIGGDDIAQAIVDFYFPANYTLGDADELLELYPSSAFPNESLRSQTATGDTQFRCARTILGEQFAKTNQSWTYRFNQKTPLNPGQDVQHASENFFMFNGSDGAPANGVTTFFPFSPVEQAFSEELLAYWISFIRAGDPNTFKLDRSPEWPGYEADNRQRIVLQEDPGNSTDTSGFFTELEPEDETARCEKNVEQVDEMEN